MRTKYYLDTCIWRDYYEERDSLAGRPLHTYAHELISRIFFLRDLILFSDLTVWELRKKHSIQNIELMFGVFFTTGLLQQVRKLPEDTRAARELDRARNVGFADALHAILAGRHGAILITQDAGFQKLRDIVTIRKPQEV